MNVKTLLKSHKIPISYVKFPNPSDEPRKSSNNHSFYVGRMGYDLTVENLEKSGFKPELDPYHANIWIGKILPDEDFKTIKKWQKMNHFHSAYLIGRKDEFHFRMMELSQRIDTVSNPIYTTTYLLPDDLEKLIVNWKTYPYWIIKPRASSKGQHIEVRDSSQQNYPPFPCIVQRYVENPFLILGRKFDLRFYVLVTSLQPMKIYIHKHGLGRFCTTKYDRNAGVKDLKMHISNWQINKDSQNFVRAVGIEEKPEDSKWSLPFFFNYLKENGYNADKLRTDMEDVTIKAIIAGMDKMRDEHVKIIHNTHQCFELLGIDLVIDEHLHPYVVEVNVSPGMLGEDSDLDKYMKDEVLLDTYNTIKIIDCDPYSKDPCPEAQLIYDAEASSITKERRQKVEQGLLNPWDCPVFADIQIVRDYLDEQKRKRNYRIVYPKAETVDVYEKCFAHIQYEDIVLKEWVKMSEQKQIQVLQEGLSTFDEDLKNALTPSSWCNIG